MRNLFSLFHKPFAPSVLLLFCIYIGLLTYFNVIDTYHQSFFVSGYPILFYHLMRVLFIVYLIWLFYAAGYIVLRLQKPPLLSTTANPRQLNNFLLYFFSGVGIWHITLFLIGLAGFYQRLTMEIISTSLLIISLPRLRTLLEQIKTSRSPINWQGCLIILLPVSLFLMTKGLYPAGGHDYYNHYFPYYRTVTETGSILPNNVWYHFYYSKGAGLFFLSMLLTDPLAPQLASTAMIFACAAMLFSILRQSSNWRLLPWIGVAFYLSFLIYTPGPLQNMHQGGWGDLEKPHEPAAVLMFAILWTAFGLIKNKLSSLWGITLILCTCTLILISPQMAVFAGTYLGIMTIIFFFKKQMQLTLWFLSATITAACCLVSLLLLNYYLTGLPDDQALFVFWPIIDFVKIKQWGVLFELLILHWQKTGLIAQQVSFSPLLLTKIFTYLRLEIWWPLLVSALCLMGLQRWQKSTQQKSDNTALYVFCVFLSLTVCFSLLIGRDQAISFYRFTSFNYAPMLCVGLLVLSTYLKQNYFRYLFLAFLFSIILINNFNGGNLGRVMKNSYYFITAQYSIADAYRHQRGWPGRMPWGGIFPAAEVVWSQLPPNTRIWSMHVHSYCMLPDCRMEGYLTNRFSLQAERIYYSNPKQAKAILQQENLNYFFISNALQLTDPLPLSPLFSPKHIANYLGIAWTDGDNTLLTWKENAISPIDSNWLDRYNRQIKASTSVTTFPYQMIQNVFDATHHHAQLTTTDLPWSIVKRKPSLASDSFQTKIRTL